MTYPGPAKRDTVAYGGRTGILGVSVVSRQHPAHVLLFRANHTIKTRKKKLNEYLEYFCGMFFR